MLDLSALAGAAYQAKPGLDHSPGTIRAWGVQKKLPEWLIEAMAVNRPVNETMDEVTFVKLASETAGLPLGRKVS